MFGSMVTIEIDENIGSKFNKVLLNQFSDKQDVSSSNFDNKSVTSNNFSATRQQIFTTELGRKHRIC